jgi:hypothetical protein
MKITQETFDQHIIDNPAMWDMFKEYAIHIGKTQRKFSAGGIFHIMRYQTEIVEVGGKFKVNQNFSSWYARKFIAEFPQYDVFKTKEV